MPLLKGSSKKTIQKNIAELTSSKPGKIREKGIKTLAKSRGITPKKAQALQAVAISYSKAKGKK